MTDMRVDITTCGSLGCEAPRRERSLYCVHHRHICVKDGCDEPRDEGRNRRYCARHRDDKEDLERRSLRSHLMRKYGISLEEYEELLEGQGGLCAICRHICSSGHRLSVDHDHRTGEVRGLLCRRCNAGLIGVELGCDWLERAQEYLS